MNAAGLRDRFRAHAQTPHPHTNAALVPVSDLLMAAALLDAATEALADCATCGAPTVVTVAGIPRCGAHR